MLTAAESRQVASSEEAKCVPQWPRCATQDMQTCRVLSTAMLAKQSWPLLKNISCSYNHTADAAEIVLLLKANEHRAACC